VQVRGQKIWFGSAENVSADMQGHRDVNDSRLRQSRVQFI
jgi:hypothetical protein